ncbi:hypothetical protein ACGFYT_28310 [Streptomyces sp. NPDC048208]|uniref:hypothetical protein n=1 Tax=Streptomyces sp. NPDC048208 TaxID=3365515 RepID=UPI00371F0217
MPSQAHDTFGADDSDQMFELGLPAALDAAADTLPPLPPGLLERAALRGRRKRRWQAARVGGGVVLTMAAVGGVLAGTGLLQAGTARPSGLTLADPAITGGVTTTAPPVGAADMVATLRSLMPEGGTITHTSGKGTPTDAWSAMPSAGLVYTDRHGTKSAVDLRITRSSRDAAGSEEGSGCLPVEVRPYDECSTRKFSDGSVLTSTKSFTYPNSDAGQRRWYVDLVTRDGAKLSLQEFGGGGEKDSASTVVPVLSMDRLASIVRSPAWRKAIDSIPAENTPGPPPGRDDLPAATRMTSVLRSLLPGGNRVSDVNSGAGWALLVHDDGKGQSFLSVEIQRDRTQVLKGMMGCAGEHLTCHSAELEDGTAVKEARDVSEKGGSAVVWQVDTLDRNGLRVVVRAINSYAEAGPVTRPEPALSMRRLRTIALDPRWRD